MNKKILFFCFLFVGLVTHLYIAIAFQSRAWIDELWAVLNPAYRLLTGTGFLDPNDWNPQFPVRTWLTPGLLFIYMKFLQVIGISNGLIVLPSVRALTSLVSFLSFICFSFFLSKKLSLKEKPWLPLLVLLFTPEFIHFSTTADLSAWGIPPLLFGLALLFFEEENTKPNLKTRLGCCLITLSALIRFQFGVFPLTCMGWLFIKKQKRKAVELCCIGTGFLFLDFLLNAKINGTLQIPILNYFLVNTAHGRASGFGVSPFYIAFEFLWRWCTEPVFLVLCLFAYFSFRRMPFLTAISLGFCLIHAFIGHKEYRFFYGPAVLLVALGSTSFQKWAERKTKFSQIILIGFLISFFSFSFWRGTKKVAWRDYEIPSKLETIVGTMPDIKGLVTYGWGGIYSGGNYTLYRPLPYVFAEKKEDLPKMNLNLAQFNYVISPQEETPCQEIIQTQSGANLLRCTNEELQDLFSK